jgi:hypothetical protein
MGGKKKKQPLDIEKVFQIILWGRSGQSNPSPKGYFHFIFVHLTE